MPQANRVIKWLERQSSIITTFISLISLIFTILLYYNGSVRVVDLRGTSFCTGFLVDDPSSYVQANPLASQKEKEYLENKINCYRDQIQKNPNDAEAYTNIGEAERRLGNLEDSRKAHQKALELEPSLPKAKIALALVEQDMGNNVAANTAIKGVLALNPSNAIAHLYQGAILYAQDEFNDAEVALQKAKQLDPKLPELVRTRRLPHLRNVQISER